MAHERWSSRAAFLFAAVGGAVGFANFWRFPFFAGQYGGGAFVLVYCAFVLMLGIPIVAAELMLGRRGRQSPVGGMRTLVRTTGSGRQWLVIGWLSILGPFCALTYYSVVASWSLDYMAEALIGGFAGVDSNGSREAYRDLLNSPLRLMFWHALYMLLTIVIVARGVRRGLEMAVKIMMPALFVLLLFLVGFAAVAGDFAAAAHFMFAPDFSKLTLPVLFVALGQAFYSLSVGGGYLMTYGAYLPDEVSLPWASASIGFIDMGVAIFAGLAIFPIVFAFGLEAGSGPGLMFETLPVAFGTMNGGALIGASFFLLLSFAGLTSSISMLEPLISWLEEHPTWTRARATVFFGGIAWLIGIVFVLSFNVWADVRPLAGLPLFTDMGLFRMMDLIVANLMLPINGLLIALFAGWVISVKASRAELAFGRDVIYRLWFWVVRYFAPLAVGTVLVISLKDGLGL